MKSFLKVVFFSLAFLSFAKVSQAHFLTLLTEDYFQAEPKGSVKVEILFTHPIEQGPHMSFKIEEKGLICGKEKLEVNLKEKAPGYLATFQIKKPSLCQFYVKQAPYFEASESKFIQQIAKGIFSFYGIQEGWDEPLGLPVEIIPLVKPFALYEGNTFKGRVLIDGKPAPNVEVEVEFYNRSKLKPPHEGFIPQVVKTDENGYFEYTFPFPGLWGFSAITERGTLKGKDGKDHPHELDGVLWVKVYPRPKAK